MAWPISNVFSRHGSLRCSLISPYALITLYVILVSHARTCTLSCGMGRNLSRVDLGWDLEWLVAQTLGTVRVSDYDADYNTKIVAHNRILVLEYPPEEIHARL